MSVVIGRIRARLNRSETLRAGGAAGVMVMARILGTLGTFIYTVLMAQMMSPQDFGLAWTLWSAVFLASYVGTLNIGAVAIREIVRARAMGDDASAAGFILVSRRILMLLSVPVMAGFVALIWWRNPVIMMEHPVAVIVAAATIPLMGWNMTNAAQGSALDQVLRSQIPRMLVRPLVFMLVLATLWLMGRTVSLEGIIVIFAAIVTLVAWTQHLILRRFFGFIAGVVPDTGRWRHWIMTGLILSPNRILSEQLKNVLVLISAVPLGAAGVAVIAVALSIVNFLNFAVSAIETSFAPKISRSLNRALIDGVPARQMHRPTHFFAIGGLLKLAMIGAGIVFLWVMMPFVLGLFGPDYADSAAAIWWFVLIPLAKAGFGNTVLVMQVFNRQRDILLTSVLGLSGLALAGAFGVPLLIGAGAAAINATAAVFALTLAMLSMLQWGLCLWRTGIDTSVLGALIRRQINRDEGQKP